mmetsp:Transcript_1586/g.3388  ORF Transcript_1586/g.3388 Transcript_1586/m.3388 type:complete len:258 (-) Transcript_1586:16-789(-)
MLQREYSHLSPQRQLRLSHFVTRFCEYYVATPFSTARQTKKAPAFLSTPVEAAAATAQTIPCGTYHQLYRINGKLIAVGVLDFLPRGLSSVYLIYLPSFSHQVMALGRYCALREIDYCRNVLRLPYYYLGYYLHSNQKMRYKGEYAPSDLLCPRHHVWVPARTALPRLLSQSPTHHCAVLFQPEGGADSMSSDSDNANPKGEDTGSVLENMHLQLSGRQFGIRDLAPDGQTYLTPILQTFLQHAGPVASVDCIIDLG